MFNLFLPLLLKGEKKKVVFISSGLADLDLISNYEIEVSGPYSLAKAATNVVVAKFHAEYAKDGVLFMSISPGVVDTEHFDPSKCRPPIHYGLFASPIYMSETKLILSGRSDGEGAAGLGSGDSKIPAICTAI